MKLGSILAVGLLSLVSLAHLLRMIYAVDLVIGNVEIPMWASVAALVIPGGIALLLWCEGRLPAPGSER